MTGSAGTLPRLSLRRLAGWFFVGVLVAGFALWSQLRTVDGELAFVLRVGNESAARPLIEEELGPIPLTEGLGHDGQYSYLIARDPFGLNDLPDLADDGAYRYRRALYGWLAGGFGLFSPRAVLVGLVAWTVIGFGAATAVTADVASLLGARSWAVLGVLGNLGLWLSVQLATADALAMALAMLAVSLALRRRTGWAVLALAAATLTKDAYLLFAIGMAGWMFFEDRRRPAIAVALVPALPLALWIGWLSWQVGDGLSAKDNFSWPLVGLVESFSEWESAGDLVQALVALAALVGALIVVVLTRYRLIAWLTIPWVVVAAASSVVVWGDGNNAVRAFAPLWLLAWLGAGWWVQPRSAQV
ncbi:MAG TPA: hypothetical protein VJ482_13615 [Acidimicrobiia bacterium]|nr:hypothetical protein [Acidimicrobiia bacterium]